LRLTHVSKCYGGVVAVRDISFEAVAGEVHALLGENGAGKSTLMGIASCDVRPDAGTVEICGQAIERLTVAEAQMLGLAIVHQHPAVLPDLTVAENLILAVPRQFRAGEASTWEWVGKQLSRVGCTVHPSTRMSDVDIAQRQLIELSKALAIEPKVLILDEPTAALTSDLVELLFERIRAATSRGAAVIYISHRLQEVRQISQRVTVMRDGEIKGTAPTNELSDEEMLRLIVGRTVTNTFPPKGATFGDAVGGLVVSRLSGSHFHDVSVTCRPGEIVGVAGITGNGQSEFLRALGGLVSASGSVTLNSKPLGLGSPDNAQAAGVTYLSSDRQKEGLIMGMSVRENAAIAALQRLARFGVMRKHLEYAEVERQRANLAIRTTSIEAPVSSLSGGNQQKVIFARALLAEPKLVLAEDPTAGVDVGARAEIYHILRGIADRGAPVVIVSSDVVELEGLCDRVAVFSRGQIAGELVGADVTEEKMGRMMVTATAHRRAQTGGRRTSRDQTLGMRLRNFMAGDYAPSLVLGALMIALAAFANGHNARFLSAFNIEKVLLLSAALTFVGLGQMCAVFTGGIDGPFSLRLRNGASPGLDCRIFDHALLQRRGRPWCALKSIAPRIPPQPQEYGS
jgi:ribose transport system ATP-binding protein